MAPSTVIIVSPYFPPSNLAGIHRARHLSRHLPAFGWRPVVLSVHERHYEGPVDPELNRLLEPGLDLVKVDAIPTRFARPIGLGEISLRGWFSLRKMLFDLIVSRDAKAVLITGSPFYPMLWAKEIKRRFGIPVLLDFQDPWLSAWGAEQPRLSKRGLSHRLAVWLEPKAVAAADFITAVSDRQNEEMRARYPRLAAEGMAGLPIGGDPGDLAAARAFPFEPPAGFDPDAINLSYVGTYWPKAEATTRLLLRALHRLREERPDLAARLKLNFIGTSYGHGEARCQVLPLAEAQGVADLVHEVPQRLSYLRALQLMDASSALLLIGSDEPHYTASKIYPMLMTQKPWLALLHRDSSACRLLEAAGGGRALAFSGPAELDALEGPMADALAQVATNASALGVPNPAAWQDQSARTIAGRYAAILDGLIAHG